MNNNCTIRLAQPDDAADVLEIYAPYIRDTAITFENDLPSQDEIAKRIQRAQERHAWIVCEYNGKVIGYAYSSQHRSREAYSWAAEVSVYIHEQFHGRGVGRGLYTVLLQLLPLQGYAIALAGMTIPNQASQKLHYKMGFIQFAQYEGIGYKFSQWHTTEWWRKDLLDITSYTPPLHPKPVALLVETQKWNRIIESGLVLLQINI